MNKEGVLVTGSANMDLVVFAENFPKPGETIFGKSFSMFPGGKGANQAVCCSRLGIPTYFIAKLGDDDFGNSLIKSMSKDNIDLSYVIQDSQSITGTALISVDGTGENEIIVISGANMELNTSEIETCNDIFSRVKVVLTQLEIPLDTVKTVAKLATDAKALFILNPAPARFLDTDILSKIDILTPNETELEILTNIKIASEDDIEKGARILLSKGVKNVIVTLGEKGALLVNQNGKKFFSSMKVSALDSTAAGDTFNGALAFGLANNMHLDDAIRLSTIAAAISVTRKGAQVSMPTLDEVKNADDKFKKVQEEV